MRSKTLIKRILALVLMLTMLVGAMTVMAEGAYDGSDAATQQPYTYEEAEETSGYIGIEPSSLMPEPVPISPTSHPFGTRLVGYTTAQLPDWVTFTITRPDMPPGVNPNFAVFPVPPTIPGYTVELLPNPAAWDIPMTAVGDTRQFRVRPNTGLAVGTHNREFRIRVEHGPFFPSYWLSPPVNISFTVQSTGISIAPNLTFAARPVGYADADRPLAQAFTVTNNGTAPLTLANPVQSGTVAYEVILPGNWSTPLAGGAERTFQVRPLAGLAAGTHTRTFTVTGTTTVIGPNQSRTTSPGATATFTVQDFSLTLSPASHIFDTRLVGYTTAPAAQTFTVTNPSTSTATVTLAPFALSIPGHTVIPAGNWTTPIAPGQSRTFTVQPDTGLAVGTHTSPNFSFSGTATVEGVSLTRNTNTASTTFVVQDAGTVSIPVTKVWVDDDDAAGFRPASITVQLQQNGTDFGAPVTITAAGSWTYTFTDLPRYSAPGVRFIYTIHEIDVPANYTELVVGDMDSGFTITNTFAPATIDIPVTKVWQGDEGYEDLRPAFITVQLQQNGTDHGTSVTLDEAGGWTYTFTNLLRYSAPGVRYIYTVTEIDVPSDYTEVITGNMDSGFTITNVFRRPPPSVGIRKEFVMPAGVDVPSASFDFEIEFVSTLPATDPLPTLVNMLTTASASFNSTMTPIPHPTISGHVYVTVDIPLDLDSVIWPMPGVFRFRVTEVAGSSSLGSNPDNTIVYDPAVFYLYVYVGRLSDVVTDPLEVLGYYVRTLIPGDDCDDCDDDDCDYCEYDLLKDPALMTFVNRFSRTPNLTTFEVRKVVTGNMGNRNMAFGFEVTMKLPDSVTLPLAENIYAIITGYERDGDGQIIEPTVRVIVSSGTAISVNPVTGEATHTFTLRHGDVIEFINVPIGTEYVVTEFFVSGYTQSGTATEGGVTGTTITAEGSDDLVIEGSVLTPVDEEEATNFVVVTNERDEVPPMGVLLNVLPFITLILAVAGVFAGYLAVKSRKGRSYA